MVGVPTLHVTTGGCTGCTKPPVIQAADSPFTEDGVQRMTDRSFGAIREM